MRIAHAVCGAGLLVGCVFSIDEHKIGPKAVPPSEDGGVEARDAGSKPDASTTPIDGPTEGLVGYWSFDDDPANGTTVRDVTNRHDGLLIGAIVRAEGAPKRGRGISTNDNSQLGQGQFRIKDDAWDNRNFPVKGTLSFWFRATKIFFEDESNHTLVSAVFDVNAGFEGRTGAFIALGVLFGQPDRMFVASLDGDQLVTQTGLDTMHGQWNHIVAVWDQINLSLYSGTAGQPLARGDDTYQTPSQFMPIDQHFRFLERLVGDLDEVRLYERPLTEAEVRAIP